jgi:hypothetical protein
MELGRRIVLDDEDICSGPAPADHITVNEIVVPKNGDSPHKSWPLNHHGNECECPDCGYYRRILARGLSPDRPVYPSPSSSGGGSGGSVGRRFDVSAPAFQAPSSAASVSTLQITPTRLLEQAVREFGRPLTQGELNEVQRGYEDFRHLSRVGETRCVCSGCHGADHFDTNFNGRTVRCTLCYRILTFEEFFKEHP